MDDQLSQYIPVLILGLVAIGFSFGTLVASDLVGKLATRRCRHPKLPIKDSAYECGMVPVGDGSSRLSVKFYLVAMLFILFDIEVLFLYPVAVQLKAFGTFALTETIVFVALLFVAFIYVWRRGALEWR